MAGRPAPVDDRTRVVRVRRRRTVRRLQASQNGRVAVLVAAGVVIGWLTTTTTWLPAAAITLPLIVGWFFLDVRGVRIIAAAGAIELAVFLAWSDRPVRWEQAAVAVVVGAAVLLATRVRGQLGIRGTRPQAMLVELRTRLRVASQIPELPRGWTAEVATRAAGGAAFSGDFFVAARTDADELLEVVLVDVSGHGLGAGTRALVLSGAFGGLLGSVPAEQFLPAANAYLLRQGWEEGFASCLQLALDLSSGEFRLHSAGHPPAAQWHAGSGRFELLGGAGPVLGVVTEPAFPLAAGVLHYGDALLLYTDGLVDLPGRDPRLALDRLLGEVERLVPHGFTGGAAKLVDRIESGDDRTVLIVQRS